MTWSDWAPVGLKSCVVQAREGSAWRLVLSTPEGAPPEGGWPLLWVLDGDLHGLTLMETARRLARRPDATGVLPMAVAAVQFGDDRQGPDARQQAFTAGPPARPEQARREGPTGGATDLLDLLAGPAREAATASGSISDAPPAIWGHSMSAWFALWAAAQTPDAFSAVAAISPSLWWDEAPLTPLEASAPPIYLAAGGKESDARPGGRRMIGRVRALGARLAEAGRPSRLHIFDGEDHASIVSASAAAALRFVSDARRDRQTKALDDVT